MTAATAAAPSRTSVSPLPIVRQSVRDLLMSSASYHELDPESRKRMAALMVQVCNTAAALVIEEIESDSEVRGARIEDGGWRIEDGKTDRCDVGSRRSLACAADEDQTKPLGADTGDQGSRVENPASTIAVTNNTATPTRANTT